MLLARFLLLEVEAFLLAFIPLLGYKLLRHWWSERKSRPALDAGDIVLIAGALAAAMRYVVELFGGTPGTMPALGAGWVWMFGACSALFAVIKTAIILDLKKTKEIGR